MDLDCENILKLISPTGFPDTWKDNPDFYAYLSKLGNYSVEQLNKEPDHLNAEKVGILNQTQELAFTNYKTFIRTAECSREIFQQFNSTEKRLDSLLEEVGELSVRCEEFVRSCEDMKRRRRVNTVCLTRHSALLQALEIPQLMETLIREAHYEEALTLANYVRRLTKTQPNIPVITSLASDVDKWWWVLVDRLVGELGSELQLARCLEVVGHLRRINVLSELELRLKFLQARDATFSSLLNNISLQDPGQHLSKTIELSRSQIFNIVTQYRAVFSEDNSLQHSTPLLQAWINHKVNEFVLSVREDLGKGVGAGSLASLLGQCMYFGASLSRVGADVRASIAPVFLNAITNAVGAGLCQAAATFSQDMAKYTLSQDTLLKQIASTPQSSYIQSSQMRSAPTSLLEFYPLSNCCNSLMSVLNELRLCAPLCLAQPTTVMLNNTLSSLASHILHFYKREQQAFSAEEKEIFSRLCVCFGHHLVTYMQQCLHQIYPPLEIRTYLSIPHNKLQAEGIVTLDTAMILAPISHLLPPQITTAVQQQISEA